MTTPNFQAQLDELESKTSEETTDADEAYSPEEIAGKISTILKNVDQSERVTRDRMLRLWKYLELLWSGAGNYYWDHTVGQWRAITQEDIALISKDSDIDPTLINKIVNVIRPYGESLVGVLTTGLPRVKYFPKDADKELDIQASKGYSNIEQRIVDDNMMPIRLMEILVKIWNGGFACAYNYSHADKKYGIFKDKVYANKDYTQESLICTECGNEVLGEEVFNVDSATDEQAPETDVTIDEMMDQEDLVESAMVGEGHIPPDMPETVPAECPECMGVTPHISSTINGNKAVEDGEVDIPKSRQIINIFGPMNVKIPAMAVRKEHIIWLILEEEIDVALAKHLYPDHKDKITVNTGSDIDIDRLSRTTYEIAEDTLRKCATIRKVWLTPASFEILEDEECVEFFKRKYPTGIKAIFCADTFLEAEEEDLSDHWTVSINPLYTRIMCDPLGKALIGLHETTNDIFQLDVDTLRYAIPQTFADPQFFDFKAYAQTRALPGSITPMKRPPGGSMNDVFAETKTATLPQEAQYIDQKVERMLQFISGVLPSVFGGPAGGSKTLGEYEQSKNQALQRLSIIWKVVSVMYAEMMAKTTKCYVQDLKEDEHFVQEKGTGNFLNVWIRKASFEGEIGEVRPELSEQFPMTWGQVSSKVMELLTGNNQAIVAWLMHPENVNLIYNVLGINDLYVPGEDQRNKQLSEISEMLLPQETGEVNPETGEPIMATPQATQDIDPMTGQPIMVSSVPIEDIDDDTIHMAVVAAFLNSVTGIELKNTDPNAYGNIMAHYQMHMMRLQQAQMQEQMAQAESASGPSEQVEES